MSNARPDMGGLPELWLNSPPDIVEFWDERNKRNATVESAEPEYTVIISGTSTGVLGERAQRPPKRK